MTRKIKVAEVITRMDWGGSPDIVRSICNYLNPEKYDVRLVIGQTNYPSKKTSEFLNKPGNKLTVIKQLKRDINPLNDFLALLKLYLLFRKEKFNIVHTHTAKAGALGRIAAKIAGVPGVIHTSHGHNFYGYFGAVGSWAVIIIEKFLTGFTSKITVLTELEKKDLMDFKVSPPDKIVIINSGLEFLPYRNVSIDKTKKRTEFGADTGMNEVLVGMINRLEPIKGPEYFIEASRLVIKKFPDVKFLVIGEGSLRGKLELQAKELKVYDKFVFTGWREDIPEILAVLDILVLPSLNEAVGRVLIEAGASGVPVVATNVGGIPEIVKDNETGILVPPKDSPGLANAIITLLEDKEKRLNMGKKAKLRINDKFSVETMTNKISGLYQELMNEKN